MARRRAVPSESIDLCRSSDEDVLSQQHLPHSQQTPPAPAPAPAPPQVPRPDTVASYSVARRSPATASSLGGGKSYDDPICLDVDDDNDDEKDAVVSSVRPGAVARVGTASTMSYGAAVQRQRTLSYYSPTRKRKWAFMKVEPAARQTSSMSPAWSPRGRSSTGSSYQDPLAVDRKKNSDTDSLEPGRRWRRLQQPGRQTLSFRASVKTIKDGAINFYLESSGDENDNNNVINIQDDDSDDDDDEVPQEAFSPPNSQTSITPKPASLSSHQRGEESPASSSARVDVAKRSLLFGSSSSTRQGSTVTLPASQSLQPEKFIALSPSPTPLTSLDTEELPSLISPPPNEWVRSMQESGGPNVNLATAWIEMGRRLREWQITVDGADPKEREELEGTMDSKFIKKASTLIQTPEEDINFHGGVDPKIKRLQGSQDLDLKAMNFVPMFDHPYIDDTTGLPGRKFTVVGFPDDIIYHFHLQVRTSSIPNAGYGVFLTFLGAQELKPSKKRRGEEALKRREPDSGSILFDSLSAMHPRGFGMKVTLTGEHLKSRYNSYYPLPELKAVVPDDRGCSGNGLTRTIVVKFSDPDLPYDEDEIEGLRNPSQRIGHLGLYTPDDYVDAPRRTFSSLHANCGYVDIGRYGPFRKDDRKMDLHHQAKAFFFGFEPNMWSFGVPETISGRDQIIDITDDLTGEPHDIARKNIPMYVNEVGHNLSNRETIHALEEEERNIKYYLLIREPLKKGDEIEVFVDYKEVYEQSRERKGYGMANIMGNLRGDDHFPSRLRRNFMERSDLLTDIEETELMDFYLLVEFCHGISENLHCLINDFVLKAKIDNECTTCQLTARQISALRRLDWITTFLRNQCFRLKNAERQDVYANLILAQCHQNIAELSWERWPELFAILDKFPTMADRNGLCIRKELEQEAVEEICFKVSHRLVLPLDERRWCPIAAELIYKLCVETARTLWQNLDRTDLARTFIASAAEAANEVRNPSNTERLAFEPFFEDPFLSQAKGVDKLKANPGNKVIVTRAEVQVFNDATAFLGGQATSMVSAGHLKSIQTTWYLARQIMYVVDTLAGVALGDEPTFSRGELISQLGIDSEVCDKALQAEILLPPKADCTLKSIRKGKSLDKANASDSPKIDGPPKPRANNVLFWNIIWESLKDKLGWTLEHGNRPNDFYAFPPGSSRGKGFRNRVDFFDSVILIIDCLKTNPAWKDRPEVQSCLQEYFACKSLYDELKVKKNALPKFATKRELTDWLRKEVKERNG